MEFFDTELREGGADAAAAPMAQGSLLTGQCSFSNHTSIGKEHSLRVRSISEKCILCTLSTVLCGGE